MISTHGCLIMRFRGSLLLQEEWGKLVSSAMWYFLVVMSRKKSSCSWSVDSVDSPAESHNSTEVWGTGTCNMSGSIWRVLRESSCHPVLAVGSWLSADSTKWNADVDLYVLLARPGATDPAVLQLICQKNRVSHRTTKATPLVESIPEGHLFSRLLVWRESLAQAEAWWWLSCFLRGAHSWQGVCSYEEFSKTKISFCEFPVKFVSSWEPRLVSNVSK